MANTYTYDDVARREDLLNIITNLTPTDTQLVSGLGTSKSNDILHQWLTDTLKSVATNKFVEGVDATYPDRTDPSRLYNYCQIFRIGYQVSDTESAVVQAGFNSRVAYEATKALKEWKADVEYALMRGSLACGDGSTARSLQGIKNWLISNNTSDCSGVSISESILNDFMQATWDDGVEVNALYLPMYMKRKISGFTSGGTKNINLEDKRLVNAVDVYESDAANMVKLFKHRYVSISGTDTNYDIVGINEDYYKVAYLRNPTTRELAKTGDATNNEVIGELTLECLNKNAGFWIQNAL
jgi:hypothetical protein